MAPQRHRWLLAAILTDGRTAVRIVWAYDAQEARRTMRDWYIYQDKNPVSQFLYAAPLASELHYAIFPD